MKFSHLDEDDQIRMVDVSGKPRTFRTAVAQGQIRLQPATIAAITEGEIRKGNVLTTAHVAGIQAAKRTAELIPLCHNLRIDWIGIEFDLGTDFIQIVATAKAAESTGLEMEALTAVSIAALTIYDMCKGVDKTMEIGKIKLLSKAGGKSAHTIDFRPATAIIVVSDSISSGRSEDQSGRLLVDGFQAAGCDVDDLHVVPDSTGQIQSAVRAALEAGTRLVVTTGGTGMGPRDVTTGAIEELLGQRLYGVEQALHAAGAVVTPRAMLSNLLAGTIGDAIIISIPGSPGAARDALRVLVPAVFHAYDIMEGAGHSGEGG